MSPKKLRQEYITRETRLERGDIVMTSGGRVVVSEVHSSEGQLHRFSGVKRDGFGSAEQNEQGLVVNLYEVRPSGGAKESGSQVVYNQNTQLSGESGEFTIFSDQERYAKLNGLLKSVDI